MRKGALLLSCLLAAACHTEVQPIVIDLSAKTPTPVPAPVQTPAAVQARTAPPAAVEVSPTPASVVQAPASRVAAGSSEQVVDGQLGARNRRDLDAFLSFYAQDAKLYDPPGRLMRSGLDQIRQLYARRFEEEPQLRATVTGRLVQGNYVVDQEEFSGRPGGPPRVIAIYELRDGKIASVWFIR